MDKVINKILLSTIVVFPLIFDQANTEPKKSYYSTTAVVSLVGGVISSSAPENTKKYKREDCPVCEGKGWYMSGDGIKKITCQYCE